MPRERGKTKIERIRHYLVGDTKYLSYYTLYFFHIFFTRLVIIILFLLYCITSYYNNVTDT